MTERRFLAGHLHSKIDSSVAQLAGFIFNYQQTLGTYGRYPYYIHEGFPFPTNERIVLMGRRSAIPSEAQGKNVLFAGIFRPPYYFTYPPPRVDQQELAKERIQEIGRQIVTRKNHVHQDEVEERLKFLAEQLIARINAIRHATDSSTDFAAGY
jgi:hypothetical protein